MSDPARSEDSDRPRSGAVLGVDAGASLVKVAERRDRPVYDRFPTGDLDALRRRLAGARPRVVGLTGGGASRLRDELGAAGAEVEEVGEFAAWALGAPRVAAEAGIELPERYLLVSVGTGTSILEIEGGRASRVGGTALGGGALVGLTGLLTGRSAFAEVAALAARGDRSRLDLRVGDIYRDGGLDLAADLTAASFGKIDSAEPADLARAVAGMVGENIALLAAHLAKSVGIARVVYCGSTVEDNPSLVEALTTTTTYVGAAALFLPNGAYCGAVGALAVLGEDR